MHPTSTPAATALLHDRVRGEVSDSSLRRAEYASDASNYRVLPAVVVFPVDAEDLVAVLDVAREHRMPVTVRGGGTSVAGNSIGEGIVVDLSVHMNRVLSIDPVGRTARVQPGTVMNVLQSEAAKFGLRLGPDPSTSTRATIAGMIGNNACGPHAIAYGKTADNVIALEVVDGAGRRFTAESDLSVVPKLPALVDAGLATIRTEFGRFGRQVSGYSLEHLLPERGHDLAKALVGTEGTLVTILEATVRLVPIPPNPYLVILGYDDMPAAADDVPRLLKHRPVAMEGLDARLVDVVRRAKGAQAVPGLPEGGGWLMIEVADEDPEQALRIANALAADSLACSSRVLPSGPDAARLWRLRADGAGLGGRTSAGRQAWPGWEDAAVPPEALGSYLRNFEQLMSRHDVDGMVYGHFGDGCIHVRLDLPLDTDPQSLRTFTTEAAQLVVAHGGSLSGEHGDGRARGELLTHMYSPRAIELMREFKALFDPEGLLNPGIIVDPIPLDAHLRRPAARPIPRADGFAFLHDGGDFTKAVHRCVGVGKCRADNSAAGEFMCPSFLATKDETHVTRGRARVLQELAAGGFPERAWAAQEVHDSLDLCLSCKACASDCPAGVDMATLKAETLFRRYRGRLRPPSHYALGWLPRWLRLARKAPRLVNAATSVSALSRLMMWAGGMDQRRTIPRLAPKAITPPSSARPHPDGGVPVVLWVDSFTRAFTPEAATAATAVLEAAGYHVVMPEGEGCCGLTWISTGQLTGARRRLLVLLDTLTPFVETGIPVVGLEPSCLAVLRSDLLELLPADPRSRALAESARTVAEILLESGSRTGSAWAPPDLSDTVAVVQPHCHQHAVTRFDADEQLLRQSGAAVTQLAGCCGLAGNFGMERGHYDTSVAVARLELLPALDDAPQDAVFVADGFSCRTQAEQLAQVRGVTLTQLFASRMTPPRPTTAAT
jgi:FAD/FMN-containing dehydrogenase/Fe-S oxidoreductase